MTCTTTFIAVAATCSRRRHVWFQWLWIKCCERNAITTMAEQHSFRCVYPSQFANLPMLQNRLKHFRFEMPDDLVLFECTELWPFCLIFQVELLRKLWQCFEHWRWRLVPHLWMVRLQTITICRPILIHAPFKPSDSLHKFHDSVAGCGWPDRKRGKISAISLARNCCLTYALSGMVRDIMQVNFAQDPLKPVSGPTFHALFEFCTLPITFLVSKWKL